MATKKFSEFTLVPTPVLGDIVVVGLDSSGQNAQFPGDIFGGGVGDHPSLTDRDLADQHPASAITVTPTGTVSATTVQAAIAELDTEKSPITHTHTLTSLGLDADLATFSVPASTTISTFGASLIDDTTQGAAQTTLGLVIGTTVQAQNPNLAAIAGQTTAADKLSYWTGSGTAGLADLSSAMRTFMTTPSSANLAALITDETGTGKNVFADAPTLSTVTITDPTSSYITYATGPAIAVSGSYSHNYSNVSFPEAVKYNATNTLVTSGDITDMGSLFKAIGVIKNNSASAGLSLGPFYSLYSGMTYKADAQTLTAASLTDCVVAPIFDCVSAGTLNVTQHVGYSAQMTTNHANATVTARHGFRFEAPTVTAGTLTGQAAFSNAGLGTARNSSVLLMGTTTPPTGNFDIYQSSARINHWNGGHQWKVTNTTTALSVTAAAHHIVTLGGTGTFTATLPDATTCTGSEFLFIKTGGSGTNTIASVSGQTFNGSGTSPTITVQYNMLRLISDGANWMVIKTGAP